jgi:hypothetical protein
LQRVHGIAIRILAGADFKLAAAPNHYHAGQQLPLAIRPPHDAIQDIQADRVEIGIEVAAVDPKQRFGPPGEFGNRRRDQDAGAGLVDQARRDRG